VHPLVARDAQHGAARRLADRDRQRRERHVRAKIIVGVGELAEIELEDVVREQDDDRLGLVGSNELPTPRQRLTETVRAALAPLAG